MKVIGHRGAAGLALENTVESIKAAVKAGVDAIEFDIRVTSDRHVVLNHDKHLGRVSQESHRINEHTLSRLRKVPLHGGQRIATLEEAFKAAGKTSLVIEGKDSGWARPLVAVLQKKHIPLPHAVIAYDHQELSIFNLLMPEVPTYALEHTKPIEIIRTARLYGFTGIDLNYWLLNPLTYWLARYHHLDIIVYTVNRPLMARFIHILYPRVSITTDDPHALQFLRRHTRLEVHP